LVTDFDYITSKKIIPFTVVPTGINEIKNTDGIAITCMPNPFKNDVQITVSDKSAVNKHLTVDVFDVNGKLICNVCREMVFSENKNLVWNGKDDNNRQLNPGIYFVKFNIDNVIKYKKIIKF